MRLGSRRRVRLARLRDCRSTSWLRLIVCRPGVKHNLEAQLEVGDAAISLPCSRQLPTLTEGLVRDDISEQTNDLGIYLNPCFKRLGN